MTQGPDTDTMLTIVQWAWVVVVAVMGWIMRRLFLNSHSVALLTQSLDTLVAQRAEDNKRRAEQRKEDQEQHRRERDEIIKTMSDQHATIIARLDHIKNGH